MKLRFYARDNLLVFVPGHARPAGGGSRPKYVGRTNDQAWQGTPKGRPASKEPYEVDSTDPSATRLCRIAATDCALWPADEATAKACGIKFVPVEIVDGVAVEKKGAK